MTPLLNEWDEMLIGGRIHHRRTGTIGWRIGRAPANAARINDLDRMTASEVNARNRAAVVRGVATSGEAVHFIGSRTVSYDVDTTGVTFGYGSSDDSSSSSSDVSGGGGDFSGAGASGDF